MYRVIRYDDEEKSTLRGLFNTHTEAEGWIKEHTSWDCRPRCGDYSDWYDPASGFSFKIIDY